VNPVAANRTGGSLMQGLPLKAIVGAAGLALTVTVSVAADEQVDDWSVTVSVTV
jgi:hypothetical protein